MKQPAHPLPVPEIVVLDAKAFADRIRSTVFETKPFAHINPAAIAIMLPLVDYFDSPKFTETERDQFHKALLGCGEAISEILTLVHKNQPRTDKARKIAVEHELVPEIAIACIAFARAAMMHPLARDRLQAALKQLQTAPGRAKKKRQDWISAKAGP